MAARAIDRRRALGLLAAGLAVPARGDGPAFAEVAARAESLEQLRALVVARAGETVFARAFRGPPVDRPVNVKSVSKTVVALLTGIAIDKGVLPGAEARLGDVAPRLVPRGADPAVPALRVADLLTMRMGLARTSGANYGAWVSSPNWVAHALTRERVAEPGARFLYSTGAYHVLGALLAEASGRSLHALAVEWLGRPLGIPIPSWTRAPEGYFMGGNNMALSPLALARIGETARAGGVWQGRQVIPADWIAASWQARTRSPFSGHDYGYGWFLARIGGRTSPMPAAMAGRCSMSCRAGASASPSPPTRRAPPARTAMWAISTVCSPSASSPPSPEARQRRAPAHPFCRAVPRPRETPMRLLPLLALCLLALPAGAVETTRISLLHDGIEREAIMDAPRDAQGAPVLVALHGGLAGPYTIRRRARVSLAREGWVVLWPYALDDWNDGRTDHLGRPFDTADDLGFLRRLIGALAEAGRIDPERVYFAGPSIGGMMVLRLLCDMPDLVAGAAIAIASFPRGFDCADGPPRPVLVIHGTEDDIVPPGGGRIGGWNPLIRERGWVDPIADTMRRLAARNRCDGFEARPLPDRTESDGSTVTLRNYRGCAAPLLHYVVEGGGHTWPGSRPSRLGTRFVGETNQDFSATRAVERFFQALAEGEPPAPALR